MPFTDRFIKVPIVLINSKLSELIGDDNDEIEVPARVNPFEVSHYYPGRDDSGKLTMTQLFFKGGEALWIKMPMNEFEKALNSNWQSRSADVD